MKQKYQKKKKNDQRRPKMDAKQLELWKYREEERKKNEASEKGEQAHEWYEDMEKRHTEIYNEDESTE